MNDGINTSSVCAEAIDYTFQISNDKSELIKYGNFTFSLGKGTKNEETYISLCKGKELINKFYYDGSLDPIEVYDEDGSYVSLFIAGRFSKDGKKYQDGSIKIDMRPGSNIEVNLKLLEERKGEFDIYDTNILDVYEELNDSIEEGQLVQRSRELEKRILQAEGEAEIEHQEIKNKKTQEKRNKARKESKENDGVAKYFAKEAVYAINRSFGSVKSNPVAIAALVAASQFMGTGAAPITNVRSKTTPVYVSAGSSQLANTNVAPAPFLSPGVGTSTTVPSTSTFQKSRTAAPSTLAIEKGLSHHNLTIDSDYRQSARNTSYDRWSFISPDEQLVYNVSSNRILHVKSQLSLNNEKISKDSKQEANPVCFTVQEMMVSCAVGASAGSIVFLVIICLVQKIKKGAQKEVRRLEKDINNQRLLDIANVHENTFQFQQRNSNVPIFWRPQSQALRLEEENKQGDTLCFIPPSSEINETGSQVSAGYQNTTETRV